ncbi:hypothetical protein D3C81_1448930 [compost metagenome]
MEQTQNRISEPLGLNGQIFVEHIVGDIFHIYRLLKRCKRIGTFRAHAAHQFVVLIRNSVFRCLARYTVNFFIDRRPFINIGGMIIFFI